MTEIKDMMYNKMRELMSERLDIEESFFYKWFSIGQSRINEINKYVLSCEKSINRLKIAGIKSRLANVENIISDIQESLKSLENLGIQSEDEQDQQQ